MGALSFENKKCLFFKFKGKKLKSDNSLALVSSFEQVTPEPCPAAESLILVNPFWGSCMYNHAYVSRPITNHSAFKSLCTPGFSKPCDKISSCCVSWDFLGSSKFSFPVSDTCGWWSLLWTILSVSFQRMTPEDREDSGTLRRKWNQVWESPWKAANKIFVEFCSDQRSWSGLESDLELTV